MASFIRIDNSIIRRRTEGITTLDDVGLFALLSAFLSIPSFRTPYGGLQAAISKHCRNGRHTIHAAWLHLCHAGYLKRVRLPDAQHLLRDLYTLHTRPDHSTPAVQYINFKRSSSVWDTHRTFLPPTEHYTPVSTAVLMDAGLSLSAKGLYAMIQQRLLLSERIGGVTLNREGLRRSSGLGECAFRKIWKELRTAGYLHLTHVWDSEKKQMLYRYELSQTRPEDALDSDMSSSVANSPSSLQTPFTQHTSPSSPTMPEYAQTTASDPSLSYKTLTAREDEPSTAQASLTELIQDQIEYDVLVTRDNPLPLLDCVVEVISRIYRMPPNEHITIRGASYPVYEVQKVLHSLDANEAEFAVQAVNTTLSAATPIKNLRGYLLACLFSAKTDFATSLLLS
jgi:hypothetical protein